MIKINGITNERGGERLFNKWFWDKEEENKFHSYVLK